jgi:hypothetical protein
MVVTPILRQTPFQMMQHSKLCVTLKSFEATVEKVQHSGRSADRDEYLVVKLQYIEYIIPAIFPKRKVMRTLLFQQGEKTARN